MSCRSGLSSAISISRRSPSIRLVTSMNCATADEPGCSGRTEIATPNERPAPAVAVLDDGSMQMAGSWRSDQQAAQG